MYSKPNLNKTLTYLSFILSFAIYLLTLERTVSFWDCGEFIASAAGLQIGHPPGAPLYAMVARLFAALAPSKEYIALMVNSFSALVSSLAIMFLYKSIVLLFKSDNKTCKSNDFSIHIAAFAAAMTFAFTDTFWFSAVEAEVYAFSSLFTAVCFWAALKWYSTENGNLQSRWIILIAYLSGLSYGVHLLNLLIIPAISYLIISKRFPLNLFKKIVAVIISSLGVGLIMYLFVPMLLWLISGLELLFVNQLHLPFNSGTLTGIALIFLVLSATIWHSYHKGYSRLFILSVCSALFSLGFGSYAMVIIRGTQNPPMNQNQVDNIFNLKYYLDRDQYGQTPLLYGPYYSAPIKSIELDKPIYYKVENKYEVKSYTVKNKYYPSHCTFFPRMYSSDPNHIEAYQSWTGSKADSLAYKIEKGKEFKEVCPTFTQNLTFFAGYQLWWMYFRYLLWNYSGRQNDLLGNGNVLTGNFITGIKPLDNLMLGPQDELPESYKGNKANNRYFMIPLLLGFIGMYFQWKRNNNLFIATLILFFFTGIAIVLFLNQTPFQVRERDYAYVGSFYVFAIWIGYGLLYIVNKLERIRYPKVKKAAILSSLGLPLLVLCQNYDDHDRSGRRIALNFAKNFLNSVPKNSLLVTYGDNDTFPLWYAQMVEGIRSDVKVFNYNYFFTSWNPSQLAIKTYENDAFKLKGKLFYKIPSKIKYSLEVDSMVEYKPIDTAIKEIFEDSNKYKEPAQLKKKPTVKIPQDVIILHNLSKNDSSNIRLLHNQRITKDQLLILDIIANNYPERTISFAQTTPERAYRMLQANLSRVGMNNELLIRPYKERDKVNLAMALESYQYLTKSFSFDSLNQKMLLDEVSVNLINTYRKAFIKTARTLASFRDTVKAVELISLCNRKIPVNFIPLSYNEIEMVRLMFNIGMNQQAAELASKLTERHLQLLNYISKLKSFQKDYVFAEKTIALHALNSISEILQNNGFDSKAMELQHRIEEFDK